MAVIFHALKTARVAIPWEMFRVMLCWDSLGPQLVVMWKISFFHGNTNISVFTS